MNAFAHALDRSGTRARFAGPRKPYGSGYAQTSIRGALECGLRSRKRFVACIALSLACSGIFEAYASDQVPTQAAPEDDSIAAAKRDLQALKSNANEAAVLPQSATTPTVAMPQFHAAEAPAVVVAKPAKPDANAAQPQTSANWLVDAMMKPKNDRSGDRRRDALDPRAKRDDELLGHRSEAIDQRRTSDRDKSTDQSQEQQPRRPDETFNPMARYMAEWLTPQDYALLRKTLETPSDRESGDRISASSTGVLSGGNDLGSAFAGLGLEALTREKDAALPTKPVENPYLQTFAFPDLPAASSSSVTTVPQPLPPSFAPPPAPESTAPKPTVPDFVKPTADDKYFKPLKRF